MVSLFSNAQMAKKYPAEAGIMLDTANLYRYWITFFIFRIWLFVRSSSIGLFQCSEATLKGVSTCFDGVKHSHLYFSNHAPVVNGFTNKFVYLFAVGFFQFRRIAFFAHLFKFCAGYFSCFMGTWITIVSNSCVLAKQFNCLPQRLGAIHYCLRLLKNDVHYPTAHHNFNRRLFENFKTQRNIG